MLKKIGLTLIMFLFVLSNFVCAGPLENTLVSSTHAKSQWSNINKITMTWQKPADHEDYGKVTGYAVLWDTVADTNPGTSIDPPFDTPDTTNTTSNPLSDGQSIYFHIRVIYENGSPYEWDNYGPFWIDTKPPSKPTAFTITVGDKALTLKWTNPGDADFYGTVIRRSTKTGDTCSYPTGATSGDNVADILKDSSPDDSYTDTGLTNDTTYCYSLFAYDQRHSAAMRNYSSATQQHGAPKSSGVTTTYATVTSTDPNNNESDVAINATINIGFSKDMNKDTLRSSTIAVKDAANNTVDGDYSYTSTTKMVKFTPETNLAHDTSYNVTMIAGGSGVKDAQGNNFDGNANGNDDGDPEDRYTFSFRTAAQTPPDVSSITPADASENVALNQKITVVFTKNLNSGTVSAETIQVKEGSDVAEGEVAYNDLDKSVTFTPASNYTGGAVVTVTVVGGANGIKDTSGLTLKNSVYNYTFTVVDTPIIQVSDTKLDFGNVSSDPADTKEKTLTVTNVGKRDLLIGNASLGSTTYYTLVESGDSCSGMTILQNGSCTIVIRFAPTITDTLQTTLSIPSNTGRIDSQTEATKTVTITGVGVEAPTAGVNVSPKSIDFGAVSLDTSSEERTITVLSNGSMALTTGDITLQKGNVGFAITDKSACEGKSGDSAIAIDASCAVKVIYTPTTEGIVNDLVLIKSNGGRTDTETSTTSTVSLEGVGKRSSFQLNLLEGWNLISLPLQPTDTSIGTVLGDLGPDYLIVWEFTPPGTWKSYDPDDPIYSDLKNLVDSKGYWVKMKTDKNLVINGSDASKTYALAQGWNLIGYSLLTDNAVGTALQSIADKYLIVWEFTPPGTWKSYDPDDPVYSDLKNLSAGKGYWIKTNQSCTLVLP